MSTHTPAGAGFDDAPEQAKPKPAAAATRTEPTRARQTAAPRRSEAQTGADKPTDANAPVPPQDQDAEESVLGAMMLSEAAIHAVTEILDPSDFYRESHGRIFKAALDLYQDGEPVDAITVADKLSEKSMLDESGGRRRIHELAALVPATSNAGHYANIVKEMSTLRSLVTGGEVIQRLGWERGAPTDELVEKAEQVVYRIATGRSVTEFISMHQQVPLTVRRLEELYERGEDIAGLATGFSYLDEYTSGLQPGNLFVVAARPSMGKSALVLNICQNIAIRSKLPVALFTLEMSREEVTQRMICSEAHVESQKLRVPKRMDRDEWKRVHDCANTLQNAPIFIEDSRLITITELRSKARRLKTKHPTLSLIVLDYIQLMTTGASEEGRVQEVSKISRALKVLAGELDVPVLALSQLSRQVEGRHDKRPQLQDLRESGSIEQDADLVGFIYRDEYYHPEDTDQQGIAELNLAKHRNGPTGMMKLSFVKRYAMFGNLAPGMLPSNLPPVRDDPPPPPQEDRI